MRSRFFLFSFSLSLVNVSRVCDREKIGSSGSNSSSRCQLQMQLLFHFKCACACNPSCVFARLRPLCCFSLQERENDKQSDKQPTESDWMQSQFSTLFFQPALQCISAFLSGKIFWNCRVWLLLLLLLQALLSFLELLLLLFW